MQIQEREKLLKTEMFPKLRVCLKEVLAPPQLQLGVMFAEEQSK